MVNIFKGCYIIIVYMMRICITVLLYYCITFLRNQRWGGITAIHIFLTSHDPTFGQHRNQTPYHDDNSKFVNITLNDTMCNLQDVFERNSKWALFLLHVLLKLVDPAVKAFIVILCYDLICFQGFTHLL